MARLTWMAMKILQFAFQESGAWNQDMFLQVTPLIATIDKS